MDFEAALSLLKAFSACRPRIYKEFSGFPDCTSQEAGKGYVLFVEASLANKQCCRNLRDFAEEHNLSVTPYGQFLMLSGP
jgi:hypothetical protein